MHALVGVSPAGASEDRRLATGFVDEDFDNTQALGVGERRILSGRPAGREKVDAGVDLSTAETANSGLIELSALGERRDEGGADSGEWCSHDVNPSTSCIVNQPRLPTTHRAAVSAPRAKPDRSRAVCVSIIVSAGPSKPIVCVPGMKPARVDATSIGRG